MNNAASYTLNDMSLMKIFVYYVFHVPYSSQLQFGTFVRLKDVSTKPVCVCVLGHVVVV